MFSNIGGEVVTLPAHLLNSLINQSIANNDMPQKLTLQGVFWSYLQFVFLYFPDVMKNRTSNQHIPVELRIHLGCLLSQPGHRQGVFQ